MANEEERNDYVDVGMLEGTVVLNLRERRRMEKDGALKLSGEDRSGVGG